MHVHNSMGILLAFKEKWKIYYRVPENTMLAGELGPPVKVSSSHIPIKRQTYLPHITFYASKTVPVLFWVL